jgi:hypothetical protein
VFNRNRLRDKKVVGVFVRFRAPFSCLIDQSQHYRNLFRLARSSLQFCTKTKVDGGKTLMITSSVVEKDFLFCKYYDCFLSERKTVIVGLDYVNLSCLPNYLVNGWNCQLPWSKGVKDIVNFSSSFKMLYYRVHSPNPSINIDGAMADCESIKEEYDYIILDTPPVGLVSDALELSSC